MKKRILELESMPEIREYNRLNKIIKLCPHKVSINGECMVCQSTSEAELKIEMDSSEYDSEVVKTIRDLYNLTNMEDFIDYLIRLGYTVTLDEDDGELLGCPHLITRNTYCINCGLQVDSAIKLLTKSKRSWEMSIKDIRDRRKELEDKDFAIFALKEGFRVIVGQHELKLTYEKVLNKDNMWISSSES